MCLKNWDQSRSQRQSIEHAKCILYWYKSLWIVVTVVVVGLGVVLDRVRLEDTILSCYFCCIPSLHTSGSCHVYIIIIINNMQLWLTPRCFPGQRIRHRFPADHRSTSRRQSSVLLRKTHDLYRTRCCFLSISKWEFQSCFHNEPCKFGQVVRCITVPYGVNVNARSVVYL